MAKIDFSQELLIANIKSCYYQACQYPSILNEGLIWYSRANLQAHLMAERQKVSTMTACGVIAALSPGNRWERNLLDAELCLKCVAQGKDAHSFKSATYGTCNKEKAVRIARSENPIWVLKGRKTVSFYQNLFNPEDATIVTVDSHAINIALGRLASIANTPSLTDSQYDFFAKAYYLATEDINSESLETIYRIPNQIQAVTWTYYRVVRGVGKP